MDDICGSAIKINNDALKLFITIPQYAFNISDFKSKIE